MNAPLQKPGRMNADEFIHWAMAQEVGRYELFGGEVIAMAPERAAHNELKLELAIRLREAIRDAGMQCQVFTDGMTVRVDANTVFEPDASVRCGSALDPDAVEFSDPVIVVEVVSPSTQSTDSNLKLDQYFRLSSVHHYLIVRTTTPAVIHYYRTPDGLQPKIVQPGPLRLDPPGITLQIGEP
jgi:Uma2 family endonuclease